MGKKKMLRLHGFGEEILWDESKPWPVAIVDHMYETQFSLFQAMLRQDHHYAVYPFPHVSKLLYIRQYDMANQSEPQTYEIGFGIYNPQSYQKNEVEELVSIDLTEQEVMGFLREAGVPWKKAVWYALTPWGYGEMLRKQNFRQYVLAAIRDPNHS